MKLRQFINILEKSNKTANTFFKKNGKNIFTSDKLLVALLEEKWSQKKFITLFSLGWIICIERGVKYRKEKLNFANILPVYIYFSDYIKTGCSFFGNRLIPFEEWEDLAKEQVDILKVLFEKNQLKSWRRTKIVRKFNKKYRSRLVLFEQKGLLTEHDFVFPSGI